MGLVFGGESDAMVFDCERIGFHRHDHLGGLAVTEGVFDQVDDGFFDETGVAADVDGIRRYRKRQLHACRLGLRLGPFDCGCGDGGKVGRFKGDRCLAGMLKLGEGEDALGEGVETGRFGL